MLRNGRLVGSRTLSDLPRTDLISMMLGHQLQETVRRQLTEEVSDNTAAPIRFSGFGKKGSVAPFDLAIKPGEAVGIAGLLGSGRTETALLMFGVEQADSGALTVDSKETKLPSPVAAIAERFAFCPEERKSDGIIGDFSVAENIALAIQAKRGWSKPISSREKRPSPSAISKRLISARLTLTSRSSFYRAATSRRPFWHAGWPPIRAC